MKLGVVSEAAEERAVAVFELVTCDTIKHVRLARALDGDWTRAGEGYARGEVRTHAGLTANRVRAPRAPPRVCARPAPPTHLTIDALYCINYLGNTQ